MSKLDVLGFLQDLQEDFLAGNVDGVLSRMATPLVIYSVAGVTVLRTHEDIMQRLGMYRDAVLSLGVVESDIEILTHTEPTSNRVRAKVRVTDKAHDGKVVTGSVIRYFLIKTDGRFQIEMMEYLEAPLPSDEVANIVH